MVDYELAEYAAAVMGNFLSAVAIYFSIITAYVVAAFSAGSRLTKLQLIIVNLSFTIAAGSIGSLSVLLFGRFYELAQRLQDSAGTVLVNYSYPMAVLAAIMYLGSLVFMWSVRRESR